MLNQTEFSLIRNLETNKSADSRGFSAFREPSNEAGFPFAQDIVSPGDFVRTDSKILVHYEQRRAELREELATSDTSHSLPRSPVASSAPADTEPSIQRQPPQVQVLTGLNVQPQRTQQLPPPPAPSVNPKFLRYLKDCEAIQAEKEKARQEMLEMREQMLKEREDQFKAMLSLLSTQPVSQQPIASTQQMYPIQPMYSTQPMYPTQPMHSTQANLPSHEPLQSVQPPDMRYSSSKQSQGSLKFADAFEESLDSSVAWVYPAASKENAVFTKPKIVEVFKSCEAPEEPIPPPRVQKKTASKPLTCNSILRALDDILNKTKS